MLNPIYNFVARAIVEIHGVLRHIVGDNGWAWALSIVLLVMGFRLVLFPLFVKQIKSQRQMQLMQPKIKELREKYKNDKQRMNEEMMKLQKEHGNPLLGCLPILVQIPLFFSVFRVMNGFGPKGHLNQQQADIAKNFGGYYPTHLNGLNVGTADQIAHAKIFGASLASKFLSSGSALKLLDSSRTSTKILCVILIVIMMATTYLTQRQIIGRNGPATDPQAALTQKLLLYVSPLFLGIFGFNMSIGVLLYWFTTNLWSMGQQFFVIRRMPPVIPPSPGGSGTPIPVVPPPPRSNRAVLGRRTAPPPAPAVPQRLVQQRAGPDAAEGRGRPSGASRPAGRRKKGGRRGGRH